jgi:alkane 1-monooxygenase
MIVLAIVPAVWRRVMDPRVRRHFDGDLSLANLTPRKRRALVEEGALAPVTRPDEVSVASTEVLAARCPGCGYTYDVVSGDEREGFAAGTAWADVPDTWCCPDCGVRDKVDFVPVEPSAVP